MNYFRFTLIDYTFNPYGDSTVIDEPSGFDSFTINLNRDAEWHGVFQDFTVNELSIESPTDTSYGDGFSVLNEAYEYQGIEAEVILQIEYRCEGCDSGDCFQEVYRARIDFGRSTRYCGDECKWDIVLEPDSCINDFRSRYDTKVNLDATESFDGTPLESYPGMGDEITLPSKAIVLKGQSESEEANSYELTSSSDWTLATGATGLQQGNFLPIIPLVTIDELPNFYTEPTGNFEITSTAQVPVVQITENPISCLDGVYTLSFRLKGRITDLSTSSRSVVVDIVVRKGTTWGSLTLVNSNEIVNYTSSGADIITEFDETYSTDITLADGEGIWVYLFLSQYNKTTTGQVILTAEFDAESYIYVQTESICEPTPAKTYLVHETLSHITESITDGCMQAKSSYYGRTDSAPFSFESDGCGGLRCFSNGLLIRRALMQDGSTPPMTMSMKEAFEGLRAIDAVGMGIEIDPATDNEILSIEPIKDFYSEDIILTLDNNGVEKKVNESQHFAKIQIGYDKWEAEEFNGLDEFLTKREYRTNLTQSAAELVLLSNLIASGYAIEITRRKGATTEDWRYDNDIFIISLERSGVYQSGFDVEQGNLSNASNIISPDTLYNVRISPVRNLLRWLWYILASYRNPTDPNSQIKFTAGDGNFVAEGIMTDSTCRLEAAIIAENEDLNINSLVVTADGVPIWYNETDIVSSPLAYDEFRLIKQDPKGLIGYTCDETVYGWIKSMDYNLKEGEATFNLIPKI